MWINSLSEALVHFSAPDINPFHPPSLSSRQPSLPPLRDSSTCSSDCARKSKIPSFKCPPPPSFFLSPDTGPLQRYLRPFKNVTSDRLDETLSRSVDLSLRCVAVTLLASLIGLLTAHEPGQETGAGRVLLSITSAAGADQQSVLLAAQLHRELKRFVNKECCNGLSKPIKSSSQTTLIQRQWLEGLGHALICCVAERLMLILIRFLLEHKRHFWFLT